jgi:hypothetical protein
VGPRIGDMTSPDYRMTVLSGAAMPLDHRLDAFFAYWRSKRGERAMPRRADIDPTEMDPRLLPYLLLTEVVDGGARFRFRLVGTEAVASIGSELTGRYVDEVNESTLYRDYITALYRRVLERRQPVFSVSLYARPDEGGPARHTTQRLMCPLSADGTTVDRVFTCQVFAHVGTTAHFPRLTADNPFTGTCEAVLE